MKFHDVEFFLFALAVVLALGIGIFAGHKVTRAMADIELMDLQAQVDTAQASLADANIELAQNRENHAVILAWDAITSFYTEASSGGTMANGQAFDEDLLTAAHRVLEFGTIILIENRENGKLCPAMITDHGPARETGRSLDVSLAVARRLGIVDQGVAPLRCYLLVQGRPSRQD